MENGVDRNIDKKNQTTAAFLRGNEPPFGACAPLFLNGDSFSPRETGLSTSLHIVKGCNRKEPIIEVRRT